LWLKFEGGRQRRLASLPGVVSSIEMAVLFSIACSSEFGAVIVWGMSHSNAGALNGHYKTMEAQSRSIGRSQT
jgi:hypothetical protein